MNQQELDKILEDHKLWIKDTSKGKRADLSNTDLSYINLSNADLYGANLYGADLSNADLSGANLIDADLSNADLSRANLSGANLGCANLSYAKGIMTFQANRHIAIAFKYNNVKHLKIGCETLTINEWLGDKGKELGEIHDYTDLEQGMYKIFLITVDMLF